MGDMERDENQVSEGISATEAKEIPTWNASDGVGGKIVPDAPEETPEDKKEPPADKKEDKPEAPKPPEGGEKPAEPDNKQKADENAALKTELQELKSQMAQLLDAIQQEDVPPAEAEEISSAAQDIKSELDSIPDDELTPAEKRMKAMLKSQEATIRAYDKRMKELDKNISNESKARRRREYEARFDAVSKKHNKDGEEWFDENDKNLVASILIDTGSDDLEGVADKLIERRKGVVQKLAGKTSLDAKTIPDAVKQQIIKDYLNAKHEDRQKVLEKGGDAPPPTKKELSLDKPKALKQAVIDRLRSMVSGK